MCIHASVKERRTERTVNLKEHRNMHGVGQSDQNAGDALTQAISYRLDLLLDDVDQGVIVYDGNGRVAFANVASARMFGYSAVAELMRASDDDRVTRVAIFDQSGFPLTLAELCSRVLRENPSIPTVLRMRAAASMVDEWFSVRARILTAEQTNAPLFLAVWDNITERQQAEARNRHLAAIVATSDDAIVSKTLDGTVTSWNHAAERLFGWSADEMVGSSIARIVPAEKRS